eukprot:TRINITY_DN3455_c0_g1_i3.p1 TRINITY_DN3455_c0_g1~~TRINITY_DN3455_c0_g1_i3.p1  ORF type:complete len:312 (+),score=101.51 TRINITY_DN3455_c0_g1_i3:24-938(+)
MIRRPPRSTLDRSSAASDVYKRQPKNLPDIMISPKVLSPQFIDPSTGRVHQRLVISSYEKRPSLVELVSWLKAQIYQSCNISVAPSASANNSMQSANPIPAAVPQIFQKEEPKLPMKPVKQVIIENESINEELNSFLAVRSVEELKLLLEDGEKNEELYNNLAVVKKQQKKLQDYIEVLRMKSLEVLDLRNLLEESARKYERTKAELSSAKKAMCQEVVNLEKCRGEYSEKTGIKSLLNTKMTKIDIQAQTFRKELKQALSKNDGAEKVAVEEIESQVEEFVKKYSKSMEEYHLCNIYSENIPK